MPTMGLLRHRPLPRGLRFVVEKHAASAMPFDLCLELDGVFKSWSIPNDLGEESAAKRLAIHTEDHPLEDGQVDIIWDRGVWVPEGSALASFRRGSLKFELQGKRLKGSWALVRTGNASTRKKDLWLLVKRSDAADAKAPAASRPKAAAGKIGLDS